MPSSTPQNPSPSSHSHSHSQSPRNAINNQQYRQTMRHQQRMQQQSSQPAFPSFNSSTSVPPPPSAIGSALPPQYGNNQSVNALHSRQQRAVSSGHSVSAHVHNRNLNNLPQFGATPSNSMISPNMHPQHQPIAYRGSGNQHGNPTQAMR